MLKAPSPKPAMTANAMLERVFIVTPLRCGAAGWADASSSQRTQGHHSPDIKPNQSAEAGATFMQCPLRCFTVSAQHCTGAYIGPRAIIGKGISSRV